MTKAVWKGVCVAESDDVTTVEFAVYFPFDSVAQGALRESDAKSTYCHWKGEATYYDIIVDGEVNAGAGWVYKEPYDEARVLAGRIAFWKGVEVEGKPEGEPLMDPGGPLGKRTGHKALCWLLVRSSEKTLSAAQVEEQIGLSGDALARAFEHDFVQPFAHRYKWKLVDGGLQKG